MNKILFIVLILLIIYYYFNTKKESYQSVGNFEIVKYPIVNNKEDALNSLCKLDDNFLSQNYDLCKNVLLSDRNIVYEDVQIPIDQINKNQFQSVSSSEGFSLNENDTTYLTNNQFDSNYICDEKSGKKIINNELTDLDCDVNCGDIINKKIYDKCDNLGVYVEENQFAYRNKGKGTSCVETYDISSCGDYIRNLENQYCKVDDNCIYGLKCINNTCIKDRNNDNFYKLSFLCLDNTINCIDSYSIKGYKLGNEKEYIVGKEVIIATNNFKKINDIEIELYDSFNRLISNYEKKILENDTIVKLVLTEEMKISQIKIFNKIDCCKEDLLRTNIIIVDNSENKNVLWTNTIYDIKDIYTFNVNINTREIISNYDVYPRITISNKDILCEEILETSKPEEQAEKCNNMLNCNSFYIYYDQEINKTKCCYKQIDKSDKFNNSTLSTGIFYLKNKIN